MTYLRCSDCRLVVHGPDSLAAEPRCPLCGGPADVEAARNAPVFAAARHADGSGPPVPGPLRMTCEVSRDRDVTCVRPAGEVDLVTAAEVDKRLQEARGAGTQNVVLDLRDVSFLDSTGVRLILRWDRLARDDGFDFALVDRPGVVRRVLELTGVRGRLSFVPETGKTPA